MKWLKRVALLALLCLTGPVLVVSCGKLNLSRDWRTADRTPAGIAPEPSRTPEAVVQAYSARAFNWRGIFAVHTWIATKPRDAPHYTVHQVMGWRKWRNLPVVVSTPDFPDRSWYGNPPEIIADLRGPEAERAIVRIDQAVRSYPYGHEYTLWPGPNSNTFTAHVGRAVPELGMELPPTAIGKDYLTNGDLVAPAPSGSGYQVSVYGLAGALASWRDGVEVNLLGLVFGVDPLGPALKLPGIGRIGFDLVGRGS